MTMKISIKYILVEYAPLASFWLLFPGFFIYQVLINLTIIPSFLGGYFGIVSMIVSIPLLFLFISQIIKSPKSFEILDYSFLLLMFYIVIVSVGNYLLGEMAGYYELLYWNLSGVMFNLVCYFLAKYFNYGNKNARRFFLLSFFFIGIIFFLNVSDGIFTLLNSGIEGSVTYQGYARSIVVISFILIASYRSSPVTILLASLSIGILIIVGSRTELVLYVGTLLVGYFAIKSVSIVGFSLISIQFLLALALVWLLRDYLIVIFEGTRLYDFIENGIFSSSSGRARLEFMSAGWRAISDSPLFGRYGVYLKDYGSTGAYPHNLLSAWLNLGLVGFTVYLSISFALLFKAFKVAKKGINSYSLLSLFFAVFITAAFLTSKDYLFLFFGLSVGFVQNIHKHRVV